MRFTSTLLATLFLFTFTACGDDDGGDDTPPFDSPYEPVPASETLVFDGLTAPVDFVRDEFGIPHIFALNAGDAAFVNGYVQAHDRLGQMNLFRHAAAGRTARIFGLLEPAQVDDDIRMRMHRLRPIAEQAWAELSASNDPADQEVVLYFTRFADGVNAYVDDLRAGKHSLDPAVEVFTPVDTFEPWTPVDSITIGRLQTWALSYDEYDLRITELMQEGRTVFDPNSSNPDLAARADIPLDVLQIRPMGLVSPLDGFPNVASDSGSRAKPSSRELGTVRPWVDPGVLAAAIDNATPNRLGDLRFVAPLHASNNWLIGPSRAGGSVIVVNDTHLPLTAPSLWWLVHVTVKDDIEVQGVSFPGLPLIQLGHNQHVAWGGTVVAHDVYDFYLEEIVPCSSGGGDCVLFEGGQVPIQTFEEQIEIGANGTVLETRTVTYETVPHHGPIIPTVVDGDIVPRTGDQAITAKFTGYEVTHEARAVFRMVRATTAAEGVEALGDWKHGGQNWIVGDDQGGFAYTTTANVPVRTPGCFSFHKQNNPDGVAPFMIMPGDGSCEWIGYMSDRYMPHVFNPEKGYLGTANSDPVGETFDDDALNGPLVDGSPLYLGALYAPGLRTARVYKRLDTLAAAGQPFTPEDMMSIHADARSNLGALLRDPLVDAVNALAAELATPGTHPDLSAFAAGLSMAEQQALAAAGARLAAWSLDTPAAMEGTPAAAEIADSSATVIFNAWAVRWFALSYGDELALVGERIEENFIARVGVALLTRPGDLITGQLLCDDLATPGVTESCNLIALRALAGALAFAESHFGSTDMDDWRWGDLHRLTFGSQLPDENLDVPPPDEPNPLLRGGYPRHGDNYAIDRSDNGLDDDDHSYGSGPAMRHITQLTPGAAPKTWFAIPGGQIHDRSSPHYRDIADDYYTKNLYLEFPWLPADVVAKAEDRWRFEPAR